MFVMAPIGRHFYGDVSSFARGYTHGMTSFQNLDALLGGFAFFEQDYRDLPTFFCILSRVVRGLQPKNSSTYIILENSDESGKVHVIQHAGATYSSPRSGRAL